MPPNIKTPLYVIIGFFVLLAGWVMLSVMTAPAHKEVAPYPIETAPMPPDSRPPMPVPVGVAPEPKPISPPVKGGGGVACTTEAKICPDGSAVGRIGPKCEFAACPATKPTPAPAPSPVSSGGTSGSCKTNADCATGYSCEDISPVVREGSQNLQCWKNGAPRPICLSGKTLIATPQGNVRVTEIHEGMLVWSVSKSGQKIAVPVRIAAKTRVPSDHHVVHLTLTDGRELFVSPGHKVADGRQAGSLKAGDSLDGSFVKSAQLIPYDQDYTYDILPGGETGLYFADGILLQSTLK